MPPMTPPSANGSTTVLATPNRVPPRAMAASRSPMGAWSKTARITAQANGIAIMETVRPAMNADPVYADCCQTAALGSVSTWKMGMKPRYWLSQRARLMACG